MTQNPTPQAPAEMGELLPCPWCANRPKPIFRFERCYVQCETQGCWLYGVMARPHEWNTRIPPIYHTTGNCYDCGSDPEALCLACRADGHPTAEPVDEMGDVRNLLNFALSYLDDALSGCPYKPDRYRKNSAEFINARSSAMEWYDERRCFIEETRARLNQAGDV